MLRAWLPAEWLPPDTTSQSAQNNSNLADQDFVSTYLDRLVINPVNNSQLVEVGFEAHDAELAAAIANEHSQLYIENDI
jgi:uncharacterized protein involved in exopolysaccharide biosynthesis